MLKSCHWQCQPNPWPILCCILPNNNSLDLFVHPGISVPCQAQCHTLRYDLQGCTSLIVFYPGETYADRVRLKRGHAQAQADETERSILRPNCATLHRNGCCVVAGTQEHRNLNQWLSLAALVCCVTTPDRSARQAAVMLTLSPITSPAASCPGGIQMHGERESGLVGAIGQCQRGGEGQILMFYHIRVSTQGRVICDQLTQHAFCWKHAITDVRLRR